MTTGGMGMDEHVDACWPAEAAPPMAAPRARHGAGIAGSAAGPACLDLRALPPPEPFAQALAAIDALAPGGELVLLTPRLPLPLLQLLEARGCEVEARQLPDLTACVRVRTLPA